MQFPHHPVDGTISSKRIEQGYSTAGLRSGSGPHTQWHAEPSKNLSLYFFFILLQLYYLLCIPTYIHGGVAAQCEWSADVSHACLHLNDLSVAHHIKGSGNKECRCVCFYVEND